MLPNDLPGEERSRVAASDSSVSLHLFSNYIDRRKFTDVIYTQRIEDLKIFVIQ
jgi:hypothetical protein